MLQFVFSQLLLVSVGIVLYLSVRSLPRLGEEEPVHKQNWLEKWITSEIPHRLDASFSLYLGKLLRKLKVWLLRVDNILTQHLKTLSSDKREGDKKIDFKEIVGEKEEDREVENP